MAYRPYHRASGKAKSNESYDPELEQEVRDWVSKVTGQPFPDGEIADVLKNGQLLCNLANKIQSGAIRKINTGNAPFMKMENIGWFVDFLRDYGVPREYNFVTVDLYEKQNIKQVVIALSWLKRTIFLQLKTLNEQRRKSKRCHTVLKAEEKGFKA